jgi:hypothetical protein
MMTLLILDAVEMEAASTGPNNVVRLQDLDAAVRSKIKMPVRLASLTNLAGVYAAASKIFTASVNAALTVDGVTAAVGDRILVAGQTTGSQNGIYTVTTAGTASVKWVLTRAEDFDSSDEIYSAVKVTVAEGTVNDNLTFVLATDGTIVLDTTSLQFTKASGTVASVGEYVGSIAASDAMPKTITQALGTKNVQLEIFDSSSGATVLAGVAGPR